MRAPKWWGVPFQEYFMKKQLCAVIVGLSVSQFGFAESNYNFLISGDLANANHELTVDGVDGSLDDSDISFSLGGYYVLNQNIGFGLRYTDFGSIEKSDFSGSLKVSADGIAATVIASTNLVPKAGEWGLGGELGFANVSMDFSGYAGRQAISASDSETTFIGGLHASYGFTDYLQGVFSLTFAKASINSLDNDITRAGLGLNFAF